MKSTGNDIVALTSIDKEKTNQPRFYSQILSATEQSQYQQPGVSNIPFAVYVWLLWSVKESAYKYLKRNSPDLVFAPTKIMVNLIATSAINDAGNFDGNIEDAGLYNGTVVFQSDTLYFRSQVNPQWIATVVNDSDNFGNVYWGVKAIANADNASRSREARAFLLSKLSSFYPGKLQTTKSAIGYPVVLHDEEDLQIPVSLAHDGGFVGYSVVLG